MRLAREAKVKTNFISKSGYPLFCAATMAWWSTSVSHRTGFSSPNTLQLSVEMSVLLFDRVEMGIRLSRGNKIKGTGFKHILLMPIGLLFAHLKTEFIY